MSAAREFTKLFRLKNLKNTYLSKVQQTSAVGLDKVNRSVFEKQLSDEIQIISRKAKNGTYNFTPYKQKLISKGAQSLPRVLSIPTFRDRITLRAICDLLSTVFAKDLEVELPQIKIEKIKKEIKNKDYHCFIKVDISGFYPSVNHSELQSALKSRIKKREIIDLIIKSITNSTIPKALKGVRERNSVGIPQGLANSNVLGEIYLHLVDKKFKSIKGIFYTRYVDDILVLCPKGKLNEISSELVDDLTKLHLTVHPLNEPDSKSNSGILSQDFDYLGYLFTNRQASLKSNNRQKFESSVVNLLTNFKYKYNKAKTALERRRAVEILNWRLNLKVTGCIFDNKKRGWIFYFSQLENQNILHEMDKVISKLISRFGLDKKIKPKKLVKAFHESKRIEKDSHKYIVNFDTFEPPQKRKILEIYLGFNSLKKKSDEEINRLFSMRIRKIIEELEEDLQDFS